MTLATGGWTDLATLRAGTVFEDERGLRYVMLAEKTPDGAFKIVFIGDGTTETVEDFGLMRVRPIPMPAARPMSADMDDDPIHGWFELSRAQYLTIPRSILEAMPTPWQREFAARLEELDATFDWRPKEGRYWVQLKDGGGRIVGDHLAEYRHPNYGLINEMRKTA